MLALIVAVAENGVIGRDNHLPWHIPEDLRYFRKVTTGNTVIMGRNTYEGMGRPLPNRRNIVVTGTPGWAAPGVETAPSLPAALALAGRDAFGQPYVIGGARLFAEALPIADTLFLTEVHRAYEGDVRFPDWERAAWREVERREVAGDPPCAYVRLTRL